MIVSSISALVLALSAQAAPAAEKAAAQAEPKKVCYTSTPSGSRRPRKTCVVQAPPADAKPAQEPAAEAQAGPGRHEHQEDDRG